jgi:hypothetical protein
MQFLYGITFQSGKFADAGKLYSQIAALNPKAYPAQALAS